jgi:tetratricopeptide (TPR) repeat protein
MNRHGVKPADGSDSFEEAIQLCTTALTFCLSEDKQNKINAGIASEVVRGSVFNDQSTLETGVRGTLACARAYHGLGLAYLISVRKVSNKDSADNAIIMNAAKAVELRERVGDFAAAGDSLNLLGSIYQCQKEYPRAEEYFLKSLEHRERVLGRFHSDLAQSWVSLGNLYCEMGDHNKAKDYFLSAKKIYCAALGDDHPRVVYALDGLAEVR